MDEKDKLLVARNQIDSLSLLFRGNDWEAYLYSSLITLRYEIDRQINLMEAKTDGDV